MTQKDYLEVLSKSLRDFDKSSVWLERSYQKCRIIGIKGNYDETELEAFETLCSRFGRAVDMIVMKVLRNIDFVELEEPGTMLDVANRAEKKGIVESVDLLRAMKDLRNELVHEYLEEDYVKKFEEVLLWTGKLFEIAGNVKRYCRKFETIK
jgi:uncharacterized protein YutE (UPF0331/DUF86 family)